MKLSPEQKQELLTASWESDNPFVTLGRIIGPELLSTVMAELAGPRGMQVYAQTESKLYESLLLEQRKTEVQSTWDGKSKTKQRELADKWGVHPRTISRDFSKE